jgi:pyridinium-3,5-biscarboxylic acid mononucleotide synthase
VDPLEIERLLKDVWERRVSAEEAFMRLKTLPYEDLGFARVDHHRALRRGFPEVIFGAGKTPEQIAQIVARIADNGQSVLVTRATTEAFEEVRRARPDARYEPVARCVTVTRGEIAPLRGRVAVVCAGTSDLPVAEEAAVTLTFLGATIDKIYDAGVAGLHRLLERLPQIREADVVVAAAGMEGALPSVVAGLVEVPVIAVPTSIGYGASFHGLAALLGMLSACASGIGVVNIDNGFGAGYLAALILRRRGSSATLTS